MRRAAFARRGGRDFADRVALVTGAAAGIGRAVVELLGRRGAALLCVDRDADAGAATVETLRGEGVEAELFVGDVSEAGDCEAALQRAVARYGGIDAVVNNAGVVLRASVVETDPDDWDRLMATNARSVYLMCRAAVPRLIARGGGAIVNVASGWGLTGGPRAAAYCASKGAVVLLTRAMAIDHGPEGIRVNCVCPGDTDTGLLREEARQLGIPFERLLDAAAERPLRRAGRPEEVAEAVAWLASDAASYVTGTALVVDGGGLAGG